MISVYKLKPGFQGLLRPLVKKLAILGVSANQITIFACILSIVYAYLLIFHEHHWLFMCISVFMLIRMGLNAVDGMLAREHDMKSNLGMYLNELCDVISDTAIYLPFIFLQSITPIWVFLFIFLSLISEFAGILAAQLQINRRYDGPMGKSDRAVFVSILGIIIYFKPSYALLDLFFIAVNCALLVTIFKRIRNGLIEVDHV